MEWSIRELSQLAEEPLYLDEELDLKDEIQARQSEVIDLSPVHVKGILLYEKHTILAQLDVEGTVQLPSSRSLEPVSLPLNFKIRERYLEASYSSDLIDDPDTLQLVLNSDVINLDEIVIQNLLLQFPSYRLTPEESEGKPLPSGKNWSVTIEGDEDHARLKDEDGVDPRFAALKQFFNDDQTSDD